MVDGLDDNGRRSMLYYKLTNEPKGSGELKKPHVLLLVSDISCSLCFYYTPTQTMFVGGIPFSRPSIFPSVHPSVTFVFSLLS